MRIAHGRRHINIGIGQHAKTADTRASYQDSPEPAQRASCKAGFICDALNSDLSG